MGWMGGRHPMFYVIGAIVLLWAISNPAGAGHDLHTWFNQAILFLRSASGR